MQLNNTHKAKDVIDNYDNAKTVYETVAKLEYQKDEMRDVDNESTYGVEISFYPISSNQPPVTLHIQERSLETAAIQIVKDAYEYRKKQVQEL